MTNIRFSQYRLCIIHFDESKQDESEKVEETNRGRNLKVGNRPGDRLPHPKIVRGTVLPYPRVICAHDRADMLQVYKILNDSKNIYPDKFLELNIRAGRKNSLKLFKRRTDRDLYKYSFTSRVVNHWNDLPDAVVLSADVNALKGNLDRFMRESRGQL